jgi:hypothetical protein
MNPDPEMDAEFNEYNFSKLAHQSKLPRISQPVCLLCISKHRIINFSGLACRENYDPQIKIDICPSSLPALSANSLLSNNTESE